MAKSDGRRLYLLAEWEWLREFVAFARGDPRLTAWEEGFVSSVGRVLHTPRRLSEKERRKVEQISAKIGFSGQEPPPTPLDVEGDDHSDDSGHEDDY